jgi:hypothetical protein
MKGEHILLIRCSYRAAVSAWVYFVDISATRLLHRKRCHCGMLSRLVVKVRGGGGSTSLTQTRLKAKIADLRLEVACCFLPNHHITPTRDYSILAVYCTHKYVCTKRPHTCGGFFFLPYYPRFTIPTYLNKASVCFSLRSSVGADFCYTRKVCKVYVYIYIHCFRLLLLKSRFDFLCCTLNCLPLQKHYNLKT